ncbi:MAG: type II toxin-antitoxin system HicA family toxin [Limosilactobacillus pontis]
MAELKVAGFEEKRSGGHKGGDHHFFQHPDGRTTVVPYTRKKDRIALGTYKAIRRQAGLDKK